MSILNTVEKNNEYDVVICGGGLAGHTLARQLKLNYADISILVLEKNTFPFPAAAHKVGESLVETSGFYLAEVLQLHDYLEAEHFVKFGLRFFWTDKNRCLSEQPEIGVSRYSSYNSYQLDRGKLDSYLYEKNKEMGVHIIDDIVVKDIILSRDDSLHTIAYKNTSDKLVQQVKGRWIIDAMGRKRFLQKKLGLLKKSNSQHNAVWFRVKGRLDIEDFVPASKTTWHERVTKERYYSTNHLMGQGYWIWLIPLSSGHTSVGLVTLEKLHSFVEYLTLDKATQWLETHEPALHAHLQKHEVVDFLKLRDYSFSSKQVFSADRWACIGDAALFPDPFYSPGIPLLGYENSMITKMIELDRDQHLTEERVAHFNRFAISVGEGDQYFIQAPYPYFDKSGIWSVRCLWALCVSWAFIYPQAFNFTYLDEEKSQVIQKLSAKLTPLSLQMETLFKDWAAKTLGHINFDFIDYLAIPFIKEIYERNTKSYADFNDVLANYEHGLEKIEEFAQTIFLLALKDTMPEKTAMFSEPIWLNTAALSLTPETWEKRGLFKPKTTPRDLNEVRNQIEKLYTN